QQPTAAALAVGVSIAVKWMSLPLLGFMAWRGGKGHTWQWPRPLFLLATGILPLALAVVPFCEGLRCPIVPFDSPFINYGRSAALIPQLVGGWLPTSIQANWIYGLPLGLLVLLGLTRNGSIWQFLERYLIALMLLSPIIHAWYFTWLTPFAVASRNWGTRLVSVSAFIYFALPYRLALGADGWQLDVWQRWVLWLPFVVGVAWSATGEVTRSR
ncbi:MAG: glycosyltransferase family 2 protein, partial [Cyanobacteria bacterium J06632_3]